MLWKRLVATVTLILVVLLMSWKLHILQIMQNCNIPTKQHDRMCPRNFIQNEAWVLPTLPANLQNVSQDSPELVDTICKDWLLPPWPESTPRRLRNPDREHYSQRGQSEFVDKLLKQKRNGFFIECGAATGEDLSNSLFFEKSRNWSGLLVEANRKYFQSLLKTHRHAYMVNACLSPIVKPVVIPFQAAGFIGGLVDYMDSSHRQRISKLSNDSELILTQCFPLFSILKAIGVSHVDYFSLDIEGAEVEILKTLPLDQIIVEVFSIEYKILGDKLASAEKLANIKEHLVKGYGYSVVELGGGREDIILKRKETL